MFRQVFDPDNLFWRIMARGVDFVGLSIFWIALCLPIVTIGPATTKMVTLVTPVLTILLVFLLMQLIKHIQLSQELALDRALAARQH